MRSMTWTACVATILTLCAAARLAEAATVTLFEDDFNSGTLAPANWTVYTGQTSPAPQIVSGVLQMNDSRDGIRTAGQFNPADYASMTISFRFISSQHVDSGAILGVMTDYVGGNPSGQQFGAPINNGLRFILYDRPSGLGNAWRVGQVSGGTTTWLSIDEDDNIQILPDGWTMSANDVIDYAVTIAGNTWKVDAHNVTQNITASLDGTFSFTPTHYHANLSSHNNVVHRYDNFKITAQEIPEPSTLALMLICGIGAAFFWKRSGK